MIEWSGGNTSVCLLNERVVSGGSGGNVIGRNAQVLDSHGGKDVCVELAGVTRKISQSDAKQLF